MNCPGSVRLIGDESSATNQAAMLGTAAHRVIELMMINDQHEASDYAGYTMLVKADGDEETEHYAPDEPAFSGKPRPGWFAFVVDEKMIEGVQHTIDEVDRLRESMYAPEVFSERYLDMTWLDPRLGGTADITLVEPFGWAHLVDHKNGWVLVEGKDNDQLKNYAVGVAHEHPDCDGVRVTISQPHAPHVDGTLRTEEFTRAELDEYAKTMKAAADATSAPNAPLKAGDWCMWCPAKTRCPAYDEMLLNEAQVDFMEDEPPAELSVPQSTDELAHKAKWIPVIKSWIRQVEGDILRELINGNKVAGNKLVHGKSNRQVLDAQAMANKLVNEVGIDNDLLWEEPKMKTPAQLEKLGVGRAQRKLVKSTVEEFSFKPPGKITVASDTDPREAVDPADEAASEFADMDDDEREFG